MTDQFREEAVSSRNQTFPSIMLGLSWVLLVFSALYGFMWLQNALYAFAQSGVQSGLISLALALVLLGAAVMIFLFKDRLRTDYEYTFTNGILDFAAIYNNKKRKALGSRNLKNIKACGKVASGSFTRYINLPGIKRSNWFVNRDADLFYIYYEKEQEKHIVIMEPSEEMVSLIRGAVPRGAYEIN
ncbi:MAG: hypothetical protein IKS05_05175 [Oscillospiraceae bacterium]|nr:hypothetical protein [Oscillospiraceae bacterium]